MYDVCFRLHGLFDVAPGRQGLGTTMIEEFLGKCLSILRGSEDAENDKKAGKHACRDKIIDIADFVRKLELPAAIHLVVDVWEQNFVAFHKAMRSPSSFGAFKPPHLRHEMAVHAVTAPCAARSPRSCHMLHRHGV